MFQIGFNMCKEKNTTETSSEYYITTDELARRLGISAKTIRNNSHKIIGRVKIGRSVRYDWQEIQYSLKMGINPIGGGYE